MRRALWDNEIMGIFGAKISPIFPVISATRPAIFGIVNTPMHSKRHVIDIASAIMYPGTTSAKQDIVKDIGAALTIANVT